MSIFTSELVLPGDVGVVIRSAEVSAVAGEVRVAVAGLARLLQVQADRGAQEHQGGGDLTSNMDVLKLRSLTRVNAPIRREASLREQQQELRGVILTPHTVIGPTMAVYRC